MLILIIGLIILAGIAMTVGVLHNRQIQKKIESGELKAAPEIVEADAECCGQHEICEKESLLAKSLCEQAHLYIWDEPLNLDRKSVV